jgi:hypothetical protein
MNSVADLLRDMRPAVRMSKKTAPRRSEGPLISGVTGAGQKMH